MTRAALTPAAIRHAVRVRSLCHPVCLGGASCAALGALAAVLSGSALVWALAGLGLLGACAGFAHQAVTRRAVHVHAYLGAVEADLERARMAALGRVRARLFDQAVAGAGADQAACALEQYQRLQAGYERFGGLLERKLNVGELTYVRYAGAVDEACMAVTARLAAIVDRLDLVRGAPVPAAAPGDLEPVPRASGAAVAAGTGDAVAAHMAWIERTLAENEAALSALTSVTDALVRMRDVDGVEPGRLEHIIADLQALAARAEAPDE